MFFGAREKIIGHFKLKIFPIKDQDKTTTPAPAPETAHEQASKSAVYPTAYDTP